MKTYYVVMDETQNAKNSIIAICESEVKAQRAIDRYNSMLAYPSDDLIVVKHKEQL